MATIPQRRLTRLNYTIPLLDAILSHFKIENLPPKNIAHPDLASLFNTKPMHHLVAALYECLDVCYRSEAILATTAARIHDHLDGILAWTARWVKYVLAPETGSNMLSKQATCDASCRLISMLLSLSNEVDEVIVASRRVFDIILWSWSDTYTSVESDLAFSLGGSRQRDTPGNLLKLDPGGSFRFHIVMLPALTRRYMDEESTKFVDRRFVDYLTLNQRRLRAFADGFAMQLSKLREVVCNLDAWKHRDRISSKHMVESLFFQFDSISILQNRLTLVPAVYGALRKAGFLEEWVYLLRDMVSTGLAWKNPERFTLYLINTFRMAYQTYTNPFSGLEIVLEAGIHDLMDRVRVSDVFKAKPSLWEAIGFIHEYSVIIYFEYANHPRGLKALIPVIESIEKNQYGCEKWATFLEKRGLAIQKFRTRLASVAMIEAEKSPAVFGFCDNEFHGSSALAVDGPRTKRDRRPQCSGCAAVFYCSEACQREDWKRRHRPVCSSIRSSHIGHEHSHILSSYRYRVLCIQLVLSKYTTIMANRSDITKVKHLCDEKKSKLFPTLPDNQTVLYLFGGILHENPSNPVTFEKLEETLQGGGWLTLLENAVTRERALAIVKSVGEKVAEGKDSRFVVAMWRYAPGHHISLAVELERDARSGRFVHVQHAAELSAKFNDDEICGDKENLLKCAKLMSRTAYTVVRRGVEDLI
ncbi:hypothetical protein CC1G_09087 [Coprinopsis cinerea okayama7|uniref:MYND-type domain-containing protein n=1 Tax=Coprinopsis cinerea (strain Okayama-7 / 130 / ATCC MYA-4618 / FGSC 9003) TaxID=240176 RepID=A8P331_COPC7|nr:hypothetical protein CC1G_09087 [Coprinopsis cinerea okayama7\|eukprot:XP_001838459.1 hypothetical protein CC1G_09087 [Coprinopsis cinerea okayama7\